LSGALKMGLRLTMFNEKELPLRASKGDPDV
jgi:hypothetical protein